MIDIGKLIKTGNKEIDTEHIELIESVNKLYTILNTCDVNENLSAKLSNMILHTRKHFAHEEHLMKDLNYPNETKHKNEHEIILNNMRLAIMQCREENDAKLLKSTLKENIESWVLNHIKEMDIPLLQQYDKENN